MEKYIQNPTQNQLPLTVQVANRRKMQSMAFANAVAMCKSSWEFVWANPDSTPEQVLAAMGKAAADSFALHAATVAWIETYAPNTLETKYKSVGKPVTYEMVDGIPTGKVTVTV